MIQAAMNDNRHIQHSLGPTANRGTFVFATLQDAAYLDRHYRIWSPRATLIRASCVLISIRRRYHQGAGDYLSESWLSYRASYAPQGSGSNVPSQPCHSGSN